MILKEINILKKLSKPLIPDIAKPVLPAVFKGKPVISSAEVNNGELVNMCPTGAIEDRNGLQVDMGKCSFCGECMFRFPGKIKFSNDYKTATNDRNALIVKEGEEQTIKIQPQLLRKEILSLSGKPLRLYLFTAAGENSNELELKATVNPVFDMGRFGISWVEAPKDADGLVLTGPIGKNIAEALENCYASIPYPRLMILAGTEAISGGIFAGSPALDRSFLDDKRVDLYVPGNPVHPLTFINGILELIKKQKS